MILKISWRNIWRSKVRSIVVIIAIALGLWAGIFASAFVVGMMEQKIDSVIRVEMSHMQLHHPDFRDEMLPEFTIADRVGVEESLLASDSVSGISTRVISMLMMNSPNKSGAIKVTGISPIDESAITDLHHFVKEGTYFEGKSRNPILISEKTAESYKVKLRSKLVLTLQDVNGEIISGAFRVVGIYGSQNYMYDEMNAFVLKEDLQELMALDEGVHEIAVMLPAHEMTDRVTERFQKLWPELEVLSWQDLSMGMRMMIGAMDTYTMVIVGIILIALLFSIINTMLMAVLERTREIGMLMALGMTKPQVFKMIMYETLFLSMIGGPLGLLLSRLSIGYFGKVGIDLSSGSSYAEYGFSNLIRPYLDSGTYAEVTVMVIIMAFLAAIYPAIKALRLKPVEAIRKI